jgi:hypothetical protein
VPYMNSAPGSTGAVGLQPSRRDWTDQSFLHVNPYIRDADAFYSGPDAAGNITHRTWDPGDNSFPSWNINLCNHPYFEHFQELYENEGTPFDASMVRSFSRKFRVLARSPVFGPVAVCCCPGIPAPYSPYIPGRQREYDFLARAIRISAKREVTVEHRSWIVTVDYSTSMPDGGPIPSNLIGLGWQAIGIENQPWLEPPHLEWDPETITKTPLADLDGKPFRNAAKQLIYPAPSVEEGVAVLVVSRNSKFATLEECRRHIEKFSYAVNYDVFLGASRGQVLSLPPKAVETYRGPLRFWKMTYRFKFKKQDIPVTTWLQHLFPTETWQPKILNAGMYEIRSGWFGPDPSGTLVPIFRGGQPINYPVLLKEDGTAAAPTDPITEKSWLRFKYYPEVTFNDPANPIVPIGKL